MVAKLKIYYELFLILLIVTSAFFVIANVNNVLFDQIVWGILFLDVVVRLIVLKDKREYIKKNPFDFIALIPLDSMFQFARFVRLFKIILVMAIFKRTPIYQIFQTNGLNKVISFVAILIILAAIPITIYEPGIETFADGMWWAIVTATTVGYGDISPETSIGRVIAVLLMVFGIGLIGMVTSSIATYFLKEKDTSSNPTVDYIKTQLDDHQNLSNHEYERLIFLVNSLKKEQEINK